MRIFERKARKLGEFRRLGTEPLEQRTLLAGDVFASVSGGSLVIRGDALDNEITVSVNASGDLVVEGQTDTTINGSADAFTVLSRGSTLSRNLSIRMLGGNDVVRLRDFTVANALHVAGGGGDDVLEINSVAVLGTTKILMGTGDDLSTLANMPSVGKLRVGGHQGDDTMVVGDIVVSGNTRWGLGSGNDRLLISGQAEFQDRAVFFGKQGADFVAMRPGDANDMAMFDDVYLRMGGGADTVVVDDEVVASSRMVVNGGRGADLFDNQSSLSDLRTRSIQNGTATDAQAIIDAIFAALEDAGIDADDFREDQTDSQSPVITTSTGTVQYEEGDSPVVVDANVTVTDEDSDQLASATIRIASGLDGDDLLAAVGSGGITVGTYNATTGLLTLTGNAPVASYQQVFRSVTFTNTGTSPGSDDRVIEFVAIDAGGNTSSAATRTIVVTVVNEGPTITPSDTMVEYTENAAPVVLDGQVVVSDPDGDDLVGATVTVTDGFLANFDALGFTPRSGITSTTEENGRILRFSGEASAANYQALLRTVTFVSTSDNPGASRTITMTVDDGSLQATATYTVSITAIDDGVNLTLPPEFSNPSVIPQRPVNQPFSFTATLTDPDNEAGEFVFQLDIEGSGIDAGDNQPTISTNGQFSWTPSAIGRYTMRIIAVGPAGDVDQETFTVEIV